MPTKCKQPKQAIHADRNQEIQRPQTNANKTFSRQRFCVWRQTCSIMAPKTGSKKLVETWRPERDLDCTAELRRDQPKHCTMITQLCMEQEKKYMDPDPEYTLQQLWDDAEPYISQKVTAQGMSLKMHCLCAAPYRHGAPLPDATLQATFS